MLFKKKLESDLSQGMLAIIQCGIVCFPGGYLKIQTIRYTELQFFMLFCMGVKLGRSH
jgi:hypothetical protein